LRNLRRSCALRALAVSLPVALVALSAVEQAQAQPTPASRPDSGAPAALSTKVTDRVIIVFRNQFSAIPATAANEPRRETAVRSDQRSVLAQLARTDARDIHSISLINAVSATISPAEAQALRSNSQVSEVVPDLPVPYATAPALPSTKARSAGITPLPGACAPDGKVQLDPEAIENIHAATQSGRGDAAQALGYTGAGVKVAFIADGLDIDNPDFIRANGQHVFVDYQDFSGTGTDAPTDGGEAFLDSSSIAAQGRHVYNVTGYAEDLNVKCNIRILGVAPGASLVGLNVIGSSDVIFNSVFLEAINYAVTVDHVNVINESFGVNPFPDDATLDLVDQANDAAVRAGVTVVVASGDAGPTDTIDSPATDPEVISAGATTTYRAYAQTGLGDITMTGVKGWSDNNISGLSSGGFDQRGATVDVVAPGDLNWALCSPNPKLYFACENFAGYPASVELTGGTSEAAPLTAGVAALVIQAYAQAHHGHDPTPAVIKQIIVSTAENINAPADQQGAGMIDAYRAVLAARSYPGGTQRPSGNAVLDSATQLNAVGQPGTCKRFSETLTNDGASTQTIGLASRTLGAYRPVVTAQLNLVEGNNYTDIVRFKVPAGQARLSASATLSGFVGISLIAPDGDFAEYNLPQGAGNYDNAQVADPAAGIWTAIISGGPGVVEFQAGTAAWQPFGTLSARSLTLAPGASGRFTLTAQTPSQPGDEAGSILLHSSAAAPSFTATSSIPVTLRALVPTPNPSVTFTGTLTGGNGRSPTTGQTSYYQVQIPAGLKALNVQVSTRNANNTFLAELVDPGTGEAASSAFNGLNEPSSITGTAQLLPEKGAQLHVLDPSPGRWTLVIDFFNTVSGTAIAQPFTVTMNDTRVPASAAGLPDSAGAVLPAGRPVTAYVTVTNNGASPEAYFVDARLDRQVRIALAAENGDYVTLPDLVGYVPMFLVPTQTTALTATADSPTRMFFNFGFAFGDPDVMSSAGKRPTASVFADGVTPGNWILTPQLPGPDGKNGINGQANITVGLSATTAAFDPAVTSGTGDMWLGGVNPFATFAPYVVNPGESATIPVTITPSGPAGRQVTGTLYIDDSSFIPAALVPYDLFFTNAADGSEVAAFSYRYTIGS
jgi:hypothetical protein